jgi:Skp family chaperone for outer membrane proteins
MTYLPKILLAAAVAVPGLMAAAAPASAQSVAVLDPDAAVGNTTAWKTAAQTIQTTYKTQITQAQTRQQQLGKDLQTALTPFDTNKDGKLSQQEMQAAQTSQPTQWKAAQAKEQAMNTELERLMQPIQRARAYAIEQISNHEDEAVSNVVKARHVTILLRPQATFVADPSADITSAVTTELDRLITAPVSVTPPANWQPGQQQQQQQAAPAPAPAPTQQQPAGR